MANPSDTDEIYNLRIFHLFLVFIDFWRLVINIIAWVHEVKLGFTIGYAKVQTNVILHIEGGSGSDNFL